MSDGYFATDADTATRRHGNTAKKKEMYLCRACPRVGVSPPQTESVPRWRARRVVGGERSNECARARNTDPLGLVELSKAALDSSGEHRSIKPRPPYYVEKFGGA